MVYVWRALSKVINLAVEQFSRYLRLEGVFCIVETYPVDLRLRIVVSAGGRSCGKLQICGVSRISQTKRAFLPAAVSADMNTVKASGKCLVGICFKICVVGLVFRVKATAYIGDIGAEGNVLYAYEVQLAVADIYMEYLFLSYCFTYK